MGKSVGEVFATLLADLYSIIKVLAKDFVNLGNIIWGALTLNPTKVAESYAELLRANMDYNAEIERNWNMMTKKLGEDWNQMIKDMMGGGDKVPSPIPEEVLERLAKGFVADVRLNVPAEDVTGDTKEEIERMWQIQRKVTNQIRQATMGDLEYKLWALREETDEFKRQWTEKFGYNQTMLQAMETAYGLTADKIRLLSDQSTQAWLDNQLENMRQQGATLREMMEATWEHELRYSADAQRGIEIAIEQRTDRYRTEAQKMYEITTSLADSIEGRFTEGFMSVIKGTESVSDAFKKMASEIIYDIIRIQLQQMVVRPLANWLAGAVGMAAMVAHSGGVVGETPFPKKVVPASTFENAPRLHKGLRNDEYPAILQTGEEVVARGQSRTMNVYQNIDFNGATFMNEGQLESTMRVVSAQMVERLAPDVIVQNYKNDGKIRDIVRGRR